MKFNLRVIAYKMQRKITQTNLPGNDRTLLSARLLTPGKTSFDANAVYIVRAADIPSFNPSALPENLICVGDIDLSTVTGDQTHNILIVDADDPSAVHSEVQQIFDYYNEIDADLMNAVIRENDLQSILDICTRFFDNPVYIIDSAQKLIACSANMNDPDWNQVKDAGILTLDVIDHLKKNNLLENFKKGPKLINADPIPPFLAVSIVENDEKTRRGRRAPDIQ